MLLLARTTPLDEVEKRSDGLSVFLVDMKAAGDALTIRPLRTMMNHATTEVFLDGVELPADALVGEEGQGFRYILDGMNAERVLIAAECIGDGRWFVEKAARYASEREVFGRPIGANQGVQFPVARAHAAIEAADLMRYKAAWLFEQGEPAGCGGEHGEAPRLRGVLGGGECLPGHPRRLGLRGGVRRRAQVPRDPPLHDRSRLEQPHPRLPRPARSRACRAPTEPSAACASVSSYRRSTRPRRILSARLAEHLEQVRFVRDAGFHSVFAGQHFLPAPFQMLQPVPLLGRLAAETGDMRVGAGILLLPLLNPVEVAEQAATLDVITGGRFVLGVGLGYRSEETAAFGAPERRAASSSRSSRLFGGCSRATR